MKGSNFSKELEKARKGELLELFCFMESNRILAEWPLEKQIPCVLTLALVANVRTEADNKKDNNEH